MEINDITTYKFFILTYRIVFSYCLFAIVVNIFRLRKKTFLRYFVLKWYWCIILMIVFLNFAHLTHSYFLDTIDLGPNCNKDDVVGLWDMNQKTITFNEDDTYILRTDNLKLTGSWDFDQSSNTVSLYDDTNLPRFCILRLSLISVSNNLHLVEEIIDADELHDLGYRKMN